MTDKTEAQPEALRLAANLRRMNMLTINCMELKQAAEALEKSHAEIVRLRALAATCYAGLGGECDMPAIWLDALNDAANGDPFDTDGLLPYTSSMRSLLVTQTNRAAAAEQQVTALTQRLDTANTLNTEARNQLAELTATYEAKFNGLQEAMNSLDTVSSGRTELNQRLAQISARQAVPEGWRLVPYEPTEEMEQAVADYLDACVKARGLWVAMLSVAPTPPEREPLSQEQIDAALIAWFGHDLANGDQVHRDAMCDAINAAHGIGAPNAR